MGKFVYQQWLDFWNACKTVFYTIIHDIHVAGNLMQIYKLMFDKSDGLILNFDNFKPKYTKAHATDWARKVKLFGNNAGHLDMLNQVTEWQYPLKPIQLRRKQLSSVQFSFTIMKMLNHPVFLIKVEMSSEAPNPLTLHYRHDLNFWISCSFARFDEQDSPGKAYTQTLETTDFHVIRCSCAFRIKE